MPTEGEIAKDCLDSLGQIKSLVETGVAITPENNPVKPAVRFALGCVALRNGLPNMSKANFDRRLPFTSEEIDVIQGSGINDRDFQNALADRLVTWLSLNCVGVGEGYVNCTDFLKLLWPHLQLTEERNLVERYIKELGG